MVRLALELVDSGILTVNNIGQVSPSSPGLAIADGDQLELGREAARNARRKPRHLHSYFWQNLSTADLARPYPTHLRTADLAHAHLSQIWQKLGSTAAEVIVLVPGVYSPEQLSLLLGITEACGIPVCGLIDLAVAAAAGRPIRQQCLHLDFHLHRAVLTVLDHQHEIVRKDVIEQSGVGLVDLYDLWARVMKQHFIRTTRFDPLHQAKTEQLLYLQLHNHLKTLTENDSTEVTISTGGRSHKIELERRELIDAARPSFDIVRELVQQHSDGSNTTLLLSDRTATMPGLVEHLCETTGIEVKNLHPAAAGSAALDWADLMCSPGPNFKLVTRLPGYDVKKPPAITLPADSVDSSELRSKIPTHLVIHGVVHRLSDQAVILPIFENADTKREEKARIRIDRGKVIIEAPIDAPVFINDEAIESPAELVVGDRLRLASNEVLLVAMAD